MDIQLLELAEWSAIRAERNKRLKEADTLFNTAFDNDLDLTGFKKYRQLLRDIPTSCTSPECVEWPQVPQLKL